MSWLLSPFVDILTFILYKLGLSGLVARFNQKDIWNIGIILAAYFLMCAGIWIGKSLEQKPDPDTSEAPKKGRSYGWVAGLSWFFTAFVIVMVIEAGGIFARDSATEARLTAFFQKGVVGSIIGVTLFLLILILFPLILLKKPRPSVRFGTLSHSILRTVSVFCVNSMILVTAAFSDWYAAGSEPMEIGFGGKVFVFIFAYIFFLLFFAVPRLALISLEPSRWAMTGYLLFLAYTVGKYIF